MTELPPSAPSGPAPSCPEPGAAPRRIVFSLRELMILAVVLALLLIALTPWYQERRTRALVARVRVDLRSLATALEAYFIDDMHGPGCALAEGPRRTRPDGTMITMPNSIHMGLPAGTGARRTISFLIANPAYGGAASPHSLTTPIAYIVAFPPNPFADSPGATYGFYQEFVSSWVVWSCGPDHDENDPAGPGDLGPVVELVYATRAGGTAVSRMDASATFLNLVYDPTNGTVSNGDIARTGGPWYFN